MDFSSSWLIPCQNCRRLTHHSSLSQAVSHLTLTEYCVLLLKASRGLWKLIPPGGWQWQLCWFLLALLGSVAAGWKQGGTDLKPGHAPWFTCWGPEEKGCSQYSHSVLSPTPRFPSVPSVGTSEAAACCRYSVTEIWWTHQRSTGVSLRAESL